MTWARIDDSFDGHPKTRRLSLAAAGLFARALSHAAQYLTDGHVDDAWVETTGRRRERQRALAELEAEGMFVRVDGGWLIHDYLDFNPSRRQVEADRAQARARQERRRAKGRQAVLPWTDVSRRDSRVLAGMGRARGTTDSTNGDRPGSHAYSAETVDGVLDELRRSPTWVVDEITTRMAVENALASHPGADPMGAARVAVGWTIEPGFECAAPGVAFAAALRKQGPPAAGRAKAEREQADLDAILRHAEARS